MLHYAYLEQIGARYDLAEELAIFGQRSPELSQHDSTYESCECGTNFWSSGTVTLRTDPHAILMRPKYKMNMPDNDLREKVAVYFHDALVQPVKKILPLLPQIMPGWGKVRIRDGDSIRTASALVRGEKMVRGNSYIRVSTTINPSFDSESTLSMKSK
jgi:hypothetical protein